MPPKNKKLNAFMVFSFEWKSRFGRHLSVAETTAEAGKVWERMSLEERLPYKEKAESRNKPQSNNEKHACTGESIKTVDHAKQKEEDRERQMKRYIETIVRKAAKNGDLETQKFYFIMVNYFTKSLTGNIYVPAEISVSEYSLKDGITRVYHSLINPACSVFGIMYQAQQHADTTHQLPLPPRAMGEQNIGKIFNEVLNFLRNPKTGDYPPVYTFRDHIPIVESVLNFMKADVDTDDEIDLQVHSLQYLFFIMKEATSEIGGLDKPKSIYITDAYFESDYFEYHANLGCEYHEEIDRSKYCTKSCVTRWGYMFSQYMCQDIAITLLPGRHLPASKEINAIVINPGHDVSASSSSSINHIKREFDDNSKSSEELRTPSPTARPHRQRNNYKDNSAANDEWKQFRESPPRNDSNISKFKRRQTPSPPARPYINRNNASANDEWRKANNSTSKSDHKSSFESRRTPSPSARPYMQHNINRNNASGNDEWRKANNSSSKSDHKSSFESRRTPSPPARHYMQRNNYRYNASGNNDWSDSTGSNSSSLERRQNTLPPPLMYKLQDNDQNSTAESDELEQFRLSTPPRGSHSSNSGRRRTPSPPNISNMLRDDNRHAAAANDDWEQFRLSTPPSGSRSSTSERRKTPSPPAGPYMRRSTNYRHNANDEWKQFRDHTQPSGSNKSHSFMKKDTNNKNKYGRQHSRSRSPPPPPAFDIDFDCIDGNDVGSGGRGKDQKEREYRDWKNGRYSNY